MKSYSIWLSATLMLMKNQIKCQRVYVVGRTM